MIRLPCLSLRQITCGKRRKRERKSKCFDFYTTKSPYGAWLMISEFLPELTLWFLNFELVRTHHQKLMSNTITCTQYTYTQQNWVGQLNCTVLANQILTFYLPERTLILQHLNLE